MAEAGINQQALAAADGQGMVAVTPRQLNPIDAVAQSRAVRHFGKLIGLAGAKLFSQVTLIPRTILWPSVFILAMIGSYAAASSFFDVWVMLIAGVAGYFLLRFGFAPAPLIMGLILGAIIEENFSKAMIIHDNSILSMLERPIVLLFFVLTLISLISPIYSAWKARRKDKLMAVVEGE